MSKPRSRQYTLRERLEKLKKSGISEAERDIDLDELAPFPERIAKILGIVKSKPIKSTTMTYLLTYDIADNKVRRLVSKYLISKGCIRIQKSVFMANTENKHFTDIHSTLKDVMDYYEHADSIILVPINVSDVRSMKLIGKNVNIETLVDPPNTEFF